MSETKSQTTSGHPSQRLAPESIDREQLVRAHGRAVYALCLSYTGVTHQAEDLMQDVFLKVFSKLNSLRNTTKAKPWLMQIARRTCQDFNRRKSHTVQLNQDIHVDAPKENPQIERIRSALARLPLQYREVINLYYLQGRGSQLVADAMGISDTAVRKRLSRARKMLHQILLEDGK